MIEEAGLGAPETHQAVAAVLIRAQHEIRCLERLDTIEPTAFNLGNGMGYSNREVIAAVERVTGRPVRVIESARRPGDPARLVASAERIARELGWRPGIPDLEAMIASAWAWHRTGVAGHAPAAEIRP